MKKLLMILAFALIGVGVTAQSVWDGFFRPVSSSKRIENLMKVNTSPQVLSGLATGIKWVWVMRPKVEISAVQFNWNKETKRLDATAFSSAGVGIGASRYEDINGELYNNLGVNALVLFNYVPTETSQASVSLAGTVSFMEIINVGAGYNFGLKTPFALTGVTLKF